MLLNIILGTLATLSFALGVWQWLAGRRFPLHQGVQESGNSPGVSLLKPVKGSDKFTQECLRSWFAQNYTGPIQLLFGATSAEDPVCEVIRGLMKEFPGMDAQLVVCGPPAGANAKVSKLAVLEQVAKYEILVLSDADVRVRPELLTNLVPKLDPPDVGLINCFYQLALPTTLAMRWEAVAVNADFWSHVLQATRLKPMDFALGAVMATRRAQLRAQGGFQSLKDCLADDYLLGNRIARLGWQIELLPLVVECYSPPQGWKEVWTHQLRWARTVRVCQPVPYFLSIVSNATLWPLLWLAAFPGSWTAIAVGLFGSFRMFMARDLEHRLTGHPPAARYLWMPLLKDLLQVGIWCGAFTGNSIEWRGERMSLQRDGTLRREHKAVSTSG